MPRKIRFSVWFMLMVATTVAFQAFAQDVPPPEAPSFLSRLLDNWKELVAAIVGLLVVVARIVPNDTTNRLLGLTQKVVLGVDRKV